MRRDDNTQLRIWIKAALVIQGRTDKTTPLVLFVTASHKSVGEMSRQSMVKLKQ